MLHSVQNDSSDARQSKEIDYLSGPSIRFLQTYVVRLQLLEFRVDTRTRRIEKSAGGQNNIIINYDDKWLSFYRLIVKYSDSPCAVDVLIS